MNTSRHPPELKSEEDAEMPTSCSSLNGHTSRNNMFTAWYEKNPVTVSLANFPMDETVRTDELYIIHYLK